MLFDLDLPTLLTRIIVLVTAFTVHEFAHAWSADRFGDDTPRMHGRLTLNPLVHLDPIGSLLLILRGFGWAKPVPVNPYALQRYSPSAMMWVAFAGPFSNLVMAVLAAIPFRLGFITAESAYYDAVIRTGHIFPTIPQMLWEFVFINLVLMLFNLIPIAPLDGEKILTYFLPGPLERTFEQIRPYGPMILLAVFFVGPSIGFDLFGQVLGPPLGYLINLLIG